MPSPSLAAGVQYMLDMRHTALGAWFVARKPAMCSGDLANKVALVTGGTAGIGLAAARFLAAAGAEVHITGRNATTGNAVAVTPVQAGGSITYHQCDLSTCAAANALVRTISKNVLQGRKLDILVQNLACMPDRYEKTSMSEGHERALSTNLLAFYSIGRGLHAHMVV